MSDPVPQPERDAQRGYGNIYTPHAGSMVIQVQREGGLANRTFVLSERRIKLLRFACSRLGIATATAITASWMFFAIQAVRVPVLTRRLAVLEQDARRIDTLQATLGRLQHRYDQLQKMFGASPTGAVPAPSTSAAEPAAREPVAPEPARVTLVPHATFRTATRRRRVAAPRAEAAPAAAPATQPGVPESHAPHPSVSDSTAPAVTSP